MPEMGPPKRPRQLQAINANARLFKDSVDPGVYSMVGAAAVLGGVCRMTISLVVIMLELTGGLDYVVPFMLSVLLAKAVGDAVNESIYDLQIVLKGYPFLHEELDVTFTERCCDIMVTRLTKLDLRLRPRLGDLKSMLASCTYRGFPIVDGEHFIGYLRRSRLEALVQRLDSEARAEDSQVSPDLLPCTDSTVMRMVPDAPLSQAHQVIGVCVCVCVSRKLAPGTFSVKLGRQRPALDRILGHSETRPHMGRSAPLVSSGLFDESGCVEAPGRGGREPKQTRSAPPRFVLRKDRISFALEYQFRWTAERPALSPPLF